MISCWDDIFQNRELMLKTHEQRERTMPDQVLRKKKKLKREWAANDVHAAVSQLANWMEAAQIDITTSFNMQSVSDWLQGAEIGRRRSNYSPHSARSLDSLTAVWGDLLVKEVMRKCAHTQPANRWSFSLVEMTQFSLLTRLIFNFHDRGWDIQLIINIGCGRNSLKETLLGTGDHK